jgi:hypothetical protein
MQRLCAGRATAAHGHGAQLEPEEGLMFPRGGRTGRSGPAGVPERAGGRGTVERDSVNSGGEMDKVWDRMDWCD